MGIRINALTETTSPGDTDNGVLDTSAGTRRITWANIKAAIFGAINGLTSKSTPVGADVIVIGDSAASFAGKKVTLTELFAQFPPVTAPVAWTPTFTGFGSVTGITARWWRVGSIMHGEVRFVAGTPSADTASFTLPNSLQTASTYPTVAHVGTGSNASDANTITVVAEASKNVIYVGCVNSAIGKPGLAKRNGNSIIGIGDSMSFQFAVQISGW